MKKKYVAMALVLALIIAGTAAVILAGSGELEEKTGWQRAVYAILHRERIQNTRYTGAVSDETWSEALPYRMEDHGMIRKDPDRDFVIMNIADLHLSDYTQDAVTNIRNFANIRRMVGKLQPDLITLTGDLVWKESTVYSIHRLTEFMDSLQIPWAPVFGNHEHEGNCDLNYLADVMTESSYCLLQKGDPALGVGNYVVNICQEEALLHTVILMDTHNDGQIYEDQLAWFRWAAGGAGVPSTVIAHIPIAQYQYIADTLWDWETGTWKPGTEAIGAVREDPCPYEDETGAIDCGLFQAMQAQGTQNMLCGHDHVNTFSLQWEGVRLSYGLRLGYGAYFDGEDRDCQGVTTITIDSTGDSRVAHHYLYPYDIQNP